MTKIQNTSTIREIRAAGGLSISEGFPTDLSNSVVPVIEVNPKAFRYANIVRSNQATATGTVIVFTTSSTKDFYLCSAQLQHQDNATADNTSTSLSATINGTSQVILDFEKLTTTATTNNATISFNNPIKIDRGTNINLSNSFTVGACTKGAVITGFEVEPFETDDGK